MALIQGTAGQDTLNGTPDDDTIIGLKDNDTLNGLGGDDLFVWSSGGDATAGTGSVASETYDANVRGDGADTVNGGDGSDTFQVNIPFYEDAYQTEQWGPYFLDGLEKARIAIDSHGQLVFDTYTLFQTNLVPIPLPQTHSPEETRLTRTVLTSIEHLQIVGGTADAPAAFTDDYRRLTYSFSTNDNFVLPNLAGTGVQDVSFDGGSGNDIFDATLAGVAIVAHGGSGNDTLKGGDGLNTLVGGTGDDTYYVKNAADIITELSGEGNDAVFTSSSSFTLSANVENLFYSGTQSFTGIGNAESNWIQGGPGSDYLIGLDGNDYLLGSAGAPDTLQGGTGDDVYFVNNTADTVIEMPGDGNDAVFASSSRFTLPANVENLFYSGTQSFTGIGNAENNWIQGGPGSDYLIGLDGDDYLLGSAGAPDTLQGGTGDDVYFVNNTADTVIEMPGEGNDAVFASSSRFTLQANVENLFYSGTQSFTGVGNAGDNWIQGGSGNDFLTGAGGNNVLNGAGGSDTADYSAAPGAISIDLSTGHGQNGYGGTDTYISIENIIGSNNADTVIGDSGNNTLNGGAGAANTMQGGAGNDTYIVQAVGDSITEFANEGTDQVQTGLGFLVLAANVENLTHIGSNDFTGIGNELNNLIIGGTGNDYLVGGAGNDTLIDGAGLNTLQGGTGDDIYAVQSNADTVFEFANEGIDEVQTFLASYTLSPNVEKLTFIGATSHTGTGNNLANTFTGGAGNDTFTGAGGNDIYNYRAAGNGFDTINDFNPDNADATEHDVIDLTGRGLNFGALTFTSVNGDVMVGIPGGDTVLLKGVQVGQLDAGDFLF
ncbi:Bifunctional hemolysin/adenylate cyclase [Bradyrhizobium ivorense]|uniref:Bifunctional hemolysin/adenylate cyclase n=1 Tax=Bradyrhizobium ivorense TaxID=2511166 RepID=A0A508TM09_9BRAD|nr:calcium-binding protein [Bradyrhizobium ivorense]VIO75412.1 Bifunctional hemolysin/adenylate cyclase [Bradyrhizobium ivorense]